MIKNRSVPGEDEYKEALAWPLISAEQAEEAVQILTADTDTQFQAIRRLEEKFARWSGSRYALSCNNGTSAIFSALYGLGLEPGSEVLVPSYTFWASVLPVLWAGLVPVFCDIDPETLCISVADIEKKYSSQTKAILVVHLFGQVADLDRILEFAQTRRLNVIEDASQSPGALFRDRRTGTLGDAGCFSFQTSKHMAAGEGGMMVTDNLEIFERAVCLGHYRRIKELKNPDLKRLNNTGMGFKFRIHPVAARIVEDMLPVLDDTLSGIHRTMETIAHVLDEFPYFSIPGVVPFGRRSYWTRFHVIYKPERLKKISRPRLIRILNNAGILVFDRVSNFQKGLHREPVMRDPGHMIPLASTGSGNLGDYICRRSGELPVTENIEQGNLLTFPVFTKADPSFLDRYVELLKSSLEEIQGGTFKD